MKPISIPQKVINFSENEQSLSALAAGKPEAVTEALDQVRSLAQLCVAGAALPENWEKHKNTWAAGAFHSIAQKPSAYREALETHAAYLVTNAALAKHMPRGCVAETYAAALGGNFFEVAGRLALAPSTCGSLEADAIQQVCTKALESDVTSWGHAMAISPAYADSLQAGFIPQLFATAARTNRTAAANIATHPFTHTAVAPQEVNALFGSCMENYSYYAAAVLVNSPHTAQYIPNEAKEDMVETFVSLSKKHKSKPAARAYYLSLATGSFADIR